MNEEDLIPKSVVYFGVISTVVLSFLFSLLLGFYGSAQPFEMLSNLAVVSGVLLVSLLGIKITKMESDIAISVNAVLIGALIWWLLDDVLGIALLVICSLAAITTALLVLYGIGNNLLGDFPESQVRNFTTMMLVVMIILITLMGLGTRAIREYNQRLTQPELEMMEALSCNKSEEGLLINLGPYALERQGYISRNFKAGTNNLTPLSSLEKKSLIEVQGKAKQIKSLSYLIKNKSDSAVRVATNYLFAPNIDKKIQCS